jgi:hypothetical protein
MSESNPAHTSASPFQPVDGLALWITEDAPGAREELTVVRLDENERLVIPFTTSMLRVNLHYAEFPTIRSFVRCNGSDCLLCRVGRQKDLRDLLPVYDVLDRTIGVLSISPNVRPHALRPALTPVLQRVARGDVLLVCLRRNEHRYLVTVHPLPPGVDDGAAVIRVFVEKFDAGQIDLASAFPMLDNATLAQIDGIRTLMTAKGIEGS